VTPFASSDEQARVRSLICRYFFGTSALVSISVALTMAIERPGVSPAARALMAAGFLLLGVVSLGAFRVRQESVGAALFAVVVCALMSIGLSGYVLQVGINGTSMGFLALLTCTACAVTDLRRGLWVAAGSIMLLTLLALAERAGTVQGVVALVEVPLGLRYAMHVLTIVGGLAAGLLMSVVLSHYLRESRERDERFSALLSIAVDSYWELDAQLRVSQVSRRGRDHRFVPDTLHAFRSIWEMPELLVIEDEVLRAHQADLAARREFRDLPVRWLAERGGPRDVNFSGRPRFGADGTFLGYWGVGRDVTAETATRQALTLTETRYRELFTRIPTPLVLHRRGRVIDANPVAASLFGFASWRDMLGLQLLDAFDDGEMRERARLRIETIEAMPVGGELPPAEFSITTRAGNRLLVSVTSVRVEADGGPATLTIYRDETERKTAEDAVLRSEALLSHLVATSPDVIMLTQMDSGRFAMVNETFIRLSGYAAPEVLGRTSEEIGLWGARYQHRALVERLRSRGSLPEMALELVCKSGRRLSMQVNAARFVMDGRDYLVINARDTTAAEQARLEREAILDNVSIGIALIREHRFMLVNPAFAQMFGCAAEELVGQPERRLWSSHEAHAAVAAQISPALTRGEQFELETPMTRADGSSFLCRLLARAVDPSHPSKGGTIWIAEDATERRRIEHALARARDEAEAASQAKSAFLANTSHEIRTPLNGLVGLARMARRPDVDEAQRRQYLDQISDSAETLSAIISDILDLSKIEAGKLHVETVAFDLHTLLATLRRSYVPLADARGLQLSLEIDSEVPVAVLGDPMRVRQILSNYVTNALKFTAFGGVQVLVRESDDGAQLRFEVVDSGPGIDLATQARLFRPFTQADESTTRRFGGTGLGLSICRELARLMGGTVGLHSEPGAGSRFWVELPLPPAQAGESITGFTELDGKPLEGVRVLMVEDNAVNMLIAVALLEQWGVQVHQAGNGEQAVHAVEQAAAQGRMFGAVLMDVQMPVMSGYEATRALRRRFDARTLPIIALTAAALVSERDQALAAGMTDFVTKPIDPQRLFSALLRARHARA
jgi:PAS domain S-box-containing protein